MKEYLNDFLTNIHVCLASKTNILNTYSFLLEQGYENEILNIIGIYKNKYSDFNFIIDRWHELTKMSNLDQYAGDLLLVCLLSKKLKEIYEEENLSESLFWDTLEDVKYKIRECENVKKVTGVFCVTWYILFFQLKIFKLGRLEYEISRANFNDEDVKETDLSIGIHIPNTGEKLDPYLVDESLDIACNFFKPLFNNKKILFKCNSWLLFGKNREFLNENSNIIKFCNRFKIVSTIYFDDYDELWRIYNCEIRGLKSLNVRNSLTSGYYEIVKNNDKIGMSLGYFFK